MFKETNCKCWTCREGEKGHFGVSLHESVVSICARRQGLILSNTFVILVNTRLIRPCIIWTTDQQLDTLPEQ